MEHQHCHFCQHSAFRKPCNNGAICEPVRSGVCQIRITSTPQTNNSQVCCHGCRDSSPRENRSRSSRSRSRSMHRSTSARECCNRLLIERERELTRQRKQLIKMENELKRKIARLNAVEESNPVPYDLTTQREAVQPESRDRDNNAANQANISPNENTRPNYVKVHLIPENLEQSVEELRQAEHAVMEIVREQTRKLKKALERNQRLNLEKTVQNISRERRREYINHLMEQQAIERQEMRNQEIEEEEENDQMNDEMVEEIQPQEPVNQELQWQGMIHQQFARQQNQNQNMLELNSEFIVARFRVTQPNN